MKQKPNQKQKDKTSNRRNPTRPMLWRIMEIHKMIKQGDFPNGTDFAKVTEMSTSTISRDIELMRGDLRAPIKYDNSKLGYYYSEKWEPPFAISESDWESLLGAKLLLNGWKDTPMYERLSETLTAMLHPENVSGTSILERFAIAPRQKSIVDRNTWETAKKSLEENKIIEFDYKGKSDSECQHRRVHPYQLVFDDGNIFIYGYSEERDDTRLFLFQRITNIFCTDETFELPKDYKFESKCGGGKFGAFASDYMETYRIEFYSYSRAYVKACIWADDQKIEDDEERDGTTLEFSSAQWDRVMSWVMSHKENAKPLAPDWFVESWRDSIDKMKRLADEK